ncbi:MAG TPA: BON domain-containing protein [Gammaproteobacteria bacterium]|nr:BON domain-containing protein [Gammaproteobacteria bacterium]
MHNAEIEKKIRAALERDTRINLHRDPIEIDFDGASVTLSGEVADIAAKRLALEHAASLSEVAGIVDRLRVRPGERMGDGAIAAHIERSLVEDSAFGGFIIRTRVGDVPKHGSTAEQRASSSGYARDARSVDAGGAGAGGEDGLPRPPWIEIGVDDGVVTLVGDVPSLSHKRLAGVLAWWAPGTRDVVNGLGVEPDEEDTDEEIVDALRIVLDKDPTVDATQIRATCKNGVVTLEGLVRDEAHRDLVEFDAWALFGVDNVVNRIDVP